MTHPYGALPQHTRWSRAVAALPMGAVDPVADFPFRITPDMRIATAGSCFAQHIARHLSARQFNHFVVEDGHPLGDESLKSRFNYGVYSARYGNVYTSRQLLQLLRRAFGRFEPADSHWVVPGGGHLDPLRPTIQPGGFATRQELDCDRAQHLRAVRRMFEQLDVFVFTLGLTECWYDRQDDAAYPLCPGVAGGEFDPARHGFINLGHAAVLAEMTAFVDELRAVNPAARIILTVSPVPLAATAIDRHVLVSTTYSKAVLRVVCEQLCADFPHVLYFPSFEIVTGSHARGNYFAEDARSVTEAGVQHVMDLFFRHGTSLAETAVAVPERGADDIVLAITEAALQTVCDEEMIEKALSPRS